MSLLTVYLNLIIITVTVFASSVLLLTLLFNRKQVLEDPKPRRFPTVTIAVPARNEEKSIGRTLEHILKLQYPKKPEIIVVDDSSTDRTAEIARSYGVRVLTQKNRGGKAKALNKALSVAKGELFGFVDADTFVGPEFLKRTAGYFNDEKVAAVIAGMKVHKPHNLLQRMQQVEYVFVMLARKILTFLNALYVTPGCAIYRRDVLRKIGGFDEKTLTEDLEIGLRLHKAGYLVGYCATTFSETSVPYTIRSFIRQRIRWDRGLLNNMSKYQDLFFERSHFGYFVFPVMLLGGVMLVIVYSMFITLSSAELVYESAAYLSGTLLAGVAPIEVTIEPSLLMFLFMFLLVLMTANTYFSMRVGRENIEFLYSVVVFLLFYSLFITAAWLITFVKELTGSERKW